MGGEVDGIGEDGTRDGTRRGEAWAYGVGRGHGEGRVGRGVEWNGHETEGRGVVVDEEAEEGQTSDMSGSSFPRNPKTRIQNDKLVLRTCCQAKKMTSFLCGHDVIFWLGTLSFRKVHLSPFGPSSRQVAVA